MPSPTDHVSRRQFLSTAAAGTAAVIGAPMILTAAKTDKPLLVGEGEYQYEVQHEWPQLPDKYTWQTTHNVAVDKSGNLYVIHEGRADLKDHPSIFVFDSDGKYIRSFGAHFLPMNFAFLDDGGFLLIDGYGASYVHRYDKNAKWVSCFGGVGPGEGTFATPHGVWVDKRAGRVPSIVVCDRAHHTLQYFTMEGKYIETLKGYGLPANVETWKNLMVVPELHARVTLLNEKNEVVARLGDDVARVTSDKFTIRGDKSKWQDGKFVHPHDACFGHDGSIFVAEWVGTGRVSKLKRLS